MFITKIITVLWTLFPISGARMVCTLYIYGQLASVPLGTLRLRLIFNISSLSGRKLNILSFIVIQEYVNACLYGM